MKRNYIRLQGAEWHNKKDNLILFSYKKNKYGCIKGFYKEKDRDGYWYTHWMNDKEIDKFRKEHGIKVTNYSIPISTVTIENSKEFESGNYKVWREGSCTFFAYQGSDGSTVKKEEKTYTEEDLLCFIHDLRSNWEDLKKWLEKKKKDDKYHYDYLERLATYDLVLNKMIGLEGRNK